MKKINNALISVFNKDGLKPVLEKLHASGVNLIASGGTYKFIQEAGYPCSSVESLTDYPSILGGRVKTLHPKVFGGILAKREEEHLNTLKDYQIPEIDLVIVDLYPFEDTLKEGGTESQLIEKIDIGGISLIRAAAKNFNDVAVVPSAAFYQYLSEHITEGGELSMQNRKYLAGQAFKISAHYDTLIGEWMRDETTTLRYGENPHQTAQFKGDISKNVNQLSGKALSYNNLVDVDSAMQLMNDFEGDEEAVFAIIKHTNACGLAKANDVESAFDKALAGDPQSAFGGILISNKTINLATAKKIDSFFYEVLIAPDFDEDALELLSQKKKRILLKVISYPAYQSLSKSCLDGYIQQDFDLKRELKEELVPMTASKPSDDQLEDMLFAITSVKHLKSNGISLVKDKQVIGIGCGQTSRVDALNQAIEKAGRMGFDVQGAVMASDAFFPFPDCVEIAHKAGVVAVVQPGGSVKDQLSIDFCNEHSIPMCKTGIRHFKH